MGLGWVRSTEYGLPSIWIALMPSGPGNGILVPELDDFAPAISFFRLASLMLGGRSRRVE